MKHRLVVIDGKMLCYILSHDPSSAGILAAKPDAPSHPGNGPYPVPWNANRIRMATKSDFDNFRVAYKGYESDPNYEPLAD